MMCDIACDIRPGACDIAGAESEMSHTDPQKSHSVTHGCVTEKRATKPENWA